MTSAFDDRIVQVGIQLASGLTTFEGLAIYATGKVYGTAIWNDCECRIFNLTKDQQQNILTQASPLKLGINKPVTMTLDVGRQSYGTFRLFEGGVITCNVTQPPDIGITLQALTNNLLGTIIANNQSSVATLETISQSIAVSLGVSLKFYATNRQIDNHSFGGAALKQLKKLNEMGGIHAFIPPNKKVLIVANLGQPIPGENRLISASTGMVGVPQVTEYGCLVKMMIDNSIELGGKVTIESAVNPSVNGPYKVMAINFEVANRDQPFFYTLTCQSLQLSLGGQ